MRPLRVAVIGFGKIAGDQHLPAIEASERLQLAATVSRSGGGPSPAFTSHCALLESGLALDAVAITTPPEARYAIARECIAAGLHVLLEKPPAATLSEAEDLLALAEAAQVSLFASWHAQHNGAVTAAAEFLAGKRIAALNVVWHEDVRKWHPGQQWIWQAGGFGVFDPGINALSILVRIFPGTLFVRSADLLVPRGAQTPIAAELILESPEAEEPFRCSFDWRRSEGEQWSITMQTADGETVQLLDGGKRLLIDGAERQCGADGEYPDIYRRFVQLIDERRSLADLRPLKLVADAMLLATRSPTDPVEDQGQG